MLTEIQCSEFLENGKPRPAITFIAGLNAVLGDQVGSNSIGKSTFLMIIDFVFGGNDYIEKSQDVQHHIGRHTIHFTFMGKTIISLVIQLRITGSTNAILHIT